MSLYSTVRAGTDAERATSESAWLQAMLDAEAALARAQARLGLVPRHAAEVISNTAIAGRFDTGVLARAARESANPVVALVQTLTAAVAQRDPAAAEYVHRGSTSQDILDTGTMLLAARCLRLILADLGRVEAALRALAREHRDTPMPGRTLTAHAVPTTFGLKAAGWRQGVLDSAEHLRRTLAALPVQLGGAAGTMAGYIEYAQLTRTPTPVPTPVPVPVHDTDTFPGTLIAAYAEELGLAAPVLPWHTLRTPVAGLGAALALTAGALGKIAADVQTLTRTEVAELAEPPARGRGASSAMPHKRNPVLATLIRSAALQVPALASVLFHAMVAEDERPAGAWHAEWQPLRDCLALVGGAAHTAAELAEGLTVFPDRMRANLDLTGGRTVSERLIAHLGPALGKATARELVSEACARSAETGTGLAGELAADLRMPTACDGLPLAALLDPAHYIGAAGWLVDQALEHGYES